MLPFLVQAQSGTLPWHIRRRPSMNTTAPITEGTDLFRSSLRVTSEAVELRDITYPISSIKSVEVLPVVANKGDWGFGIYFFDMVGSLQIGNLAVDLRIWELQVTAQGWAILFSAVAAYLFMAYLLRWLYNRSRKYWRYIYAADLNTDYGRTLVAASHDEIYITHIVSTINAALAELRKVKHLTGEGESGDKALSGNAALHNGQSLRTPMLYDNYFRISDYVEVPGWSALLSDVRYANKTRLEGRDNHFGIRPWQPLLFLVFGVTIKTGSRLFPDPLFIAVSIVMAIIILLSLWARSKNKLKKGPQTIDYIYIARLGVAGNDMPVLISVDHGFVDKFVTSITEVVRKRTASTRKPTSSIRRTT